MCVCVFVFVCVCVCVCRTIVRVLGAEVIIGTKNRLRDLIV